MTLFETLVPDGYSIEARRLKGDTWILEYTERFSEEDWTRGLSTKDVIIENARRYIGDHAEIQVNEEDRSIIVKTQGPRKLIFNMLSTEFLLGSTFGEMKLKDLIGLAAFNVLRYGIKKIPTDT